MRVLGKPAGIFVLLMDAVKGYVACAFLPHWSSTGLILIFPGSLFIFKTGRLNTRSGFTWSPDCLPCWATITPAGSDSRAARALRRAPVFIWRCAQWPLLIAVVAFILALLATRYVSVGSISAAVALPVAVWVLPPHNLLLGIVTTVLGAMAIYKHKGNLQRLAAGTENRLQFKKKETT
jgi:acyl phosphate:glycerol-3-phosphate acyltransferase